MSRRCDCDALLEALETDPRLRLVPLAARMLWVLLMDGLTLHREAMWRGAPAAINELEIDAYVPVLITAGLARWRADGSIEAIAPAVARNGG
jgi:hypothetical protein